MLANFRSYQLAVELYHETKAIKLPSYLKDQLNRAASSVALNLSEGSAKPTKKDRLRFYAIAFGSLREIQALVDLEHEKLASIAPLTDKLAAHLYKLCRNPSPERKRISGCRLPAPRLPFAHFSFTCPSLRQSYCQVAVSHVKTGHSRLGIWRFFCND